MVLRCKKLCSAGYGTKVGVVVYQPLVAKMNAGYGTKVGVVVYQLLVAQN